MAHDGTVINGKVVGEGDGVAEAMALPRQRSLKRAIGYGVLSLIPATFLTLVLGPFGVALGMLGILMHIRRGWRCETLTTGKPLEVDRAERAAGLEKAKAEATKLGPMRTGDMVKFLVGCCLLGLLFGGPVGLVIGLLIWFAVIVIGTIVRSGGA